MTTNSKELDYSEILHRLLGEDKLNNLKRELASQVIDNTPIEYKEYDIKLSVPTTAAHLLEILTEILPIEIETILSKMASQGLNNILEESTKPPEEDTKTNILDNIEPVERLIRELSNLENLSNGLYNLGASERKIKAA